MVSAAGEKRVKRLRAMDKDFLIILSP